MGGFQPPIGSIPAAGSRRSEGERAGRGIEVSKLKPCPRSGRARIPPRSRRSIRGQDARLRRVPGECAEAVPLSFAHTRSRPDTRGATDRPCRHGDTPPWSAARARKDGGFPLSEDPRAASRHSCRSNPVPDRGRDASGRKQFPRRKFSSLPGSCPMHPLPETRGLSPLRQTISCAECQASDFKHRLSAHGLSVGSLSLALIRRNVSASRRCSISSPASIRTRNSHPSP